jgi:hypothetical protein
MLVTGVPVPSALSTSSATLRELATTADARDT